MNGIARLGSRELFALGILVVGLGIGYLTFLAGLSFAFGAFVAGMVLSESDHGHQALSDIVPVRDLFGLLFFASVGMLLDPGFLVAHFGEVLTLVAAVACGKGIIFAGVTRFFGYGNVIPLAVGLGLFQIGEFSFVLARIGLKHGSIDEELYSLVLTAALVTMFLTPLISSQTARIYDLVRRKRKNEALQSINLPDDGLRDHVVIAGGGRIGSQVADVLRRVGLPFVIIELDQRRLESTKLAKFPVIYGDASQEIVLEAASTSEASLLLITTPSVVVGRAIAEKGRHLNDDIVIVARGTDSDSIGSYRDLSVSEVVLPEFEAGLEMLRAALTRQGLDAAEIQRHTEDLRREKFGPILNVNNHRRTIHSMKNAQNQFELQWFTVRPSSALVDRSLRESEIRSRTGTSVVGILREYILIPTPDPDEILRPDDHIAIIGTKEGRENFADLLNGRLKANDD